MFVLQQFQLLYISTVAIAELGPAQSHLVIDAIQSTNPSAKNCRNIGPQDKTLVPKSRRSLVQNILQKPRNIGPSYHTYFGI